jgi:hypothetical protein
MTIGALSARTSGAARFAAGFVRERVDVEVGV